jgi:hypothetical protein
LNKLRRQFMSGKIMQHSFKEINNIILERLLKDSFYMEENVNKPSILEKFNSVFESDKEDPVNLDGEIKETYEKAQNKLFKMYDEYKSEDKKMGVETMGDKFNAMYDHYPEESEKIMQEYISKVTEKDKNNDVEEITKPSFCSFIPIKRGIKTTVKSIVGPVEISVLRSVTEILKISEEKEEKLNLDEIIELYKEKYPFNKTIKYDTFLLICPSTTLKELKQQLHDLSLFLDPIISSMRTLSNGSYNAFLYNDEEITKSENMILSRIPKMGLSKSDKTQESLQNFIFDFDVKSIEKFNDSSSKGISNYVSTGESSLSPPDLDFKRMGTLLNELLEGEEISFSGGVYNELELADLLLLEEDLEKRIKNEEETANISELKSVKKRIKNIEQIQNDMNSKHNKKLKDIHEESKQEKDNYNNYEAETIEIDEIDEGDLEREGAGEDNERDSEDESDNDDGLNFGGIPDDNDL